MDQTVKPAIEFRKPDYGYGNRPGLAYIEVVKLVPNIGGVALDPHASLEELDYNPNPEPLFTESQLRDKVTEVATNYHTIYDPASTERAPKQFGITIANKQRLDEGVPAIVILSSGAASLYDEKGNVNTYDNALEIAYTAFKYPDQPVVYIESPGNGNSVNLTDEEYAQAAHDGKLVHESRSPSGKIADYEAFETFQAMARALADTGIDVSRISSNAAGAHASTALLAALPEGTMERAFLYNPTNISDRNWLWLSALTVKEILTQNKYANTSKDPLKITPKRSAMAKEVMGVASDSLIRRRLQQARASTHDLGKLKKQQKMFRRGNAHGQSGAVQLVVGQLRHPALRQTVVLPEFAAQYKDPRDFQEFVRLVKVLGGSVVEIADVETLSIPLGQYGHSHYPSVRQTFESYAFNRNS